MNIFYGFKVDGLWVIGELMIMFFVIVEDYLGDIEDWLIVEVVGLVMEMLFEYLIELLFILFIK